MLSNPKTTLVGYAMIAVGALQIIIHIIQGDFALQDHIAELLTGLAGVGFVLAKDGGH